MYFLHLLIQIFYIIPIYYTLIVNALQTKNNELTKIGKVLTKELEEIDVKIKQMNSDSEKYKIKTRLETLIPSLEASIVNLRAQYKEYKQK